MKKLIASTVAAMLLAGIFVVGCETSHSESDEPTLTGGHKHEETTTYKNPVTGDTTVEHQSQRTPGQ